MKRTFLARRNRLLSGHSLSWGFWAFLFALIVLIFRLVLPNLFLYTFTPAIRISNTLSSEANAFLGSFRNASAITLKNQSLENENAVLASKNQTLEQKLADLTKLLGSNSNSDGHGLVLGVVTHPPQSPYDTLVVAGGTTAGVALGMEAFANDNVPIGIVSGVTKDFSRITLFSAANIQVDGWVGSAHTPLTIVGTGGGTMTASVARSAPVAVGDVVFVPGPGQLPLGTIAYVNADPLSPNVKLRITPAVNLFSIAWVVVRATGGVSMSFATSTSL